MPDDVYTHGHHDSVLQSHRWRTAANSAGYLLPHLHPGDTLLDVGCGPGTITADLAAAVAPGRVVAIDRSADVLVTRPGGLGTARDADFGASVWYFASPADRDWWSQSWAGRATSSDFAVQARDRGLATDADLGRIADAWREWGAHPDGWLVLVHGEVLATR